MRDSGVIDLFAIHKEEEARISATPSAPPPAFSMDIGGANSNPLLMDSDEDVDGFAAASAKSRKRTKIIGGVIGGVAVLGILIAVMTSGSKQAEPEKAAAAPPPPPAMTVPPPAATDPPPPVPAPPSTAKGKADYTPATAAAAYNSSQGKKKTSTAKSSPKSAAGGGIKLQKVQSSGTGG